MVSLKPFKSFAPTDFETTVYPFNIEKNVCGGDRIARVVGSFVALFIAVKAISARRPVLALFALCAAFGLALNAIAGRCVASAVLEVDTCED